MQSRSAEVGWTPTATHFTSLPQRRNHRDPDSLSSRYFTRPASEAMIRRIRPDVNRFAGPLGLLNNGGLRGGSGRCAVTYPRHSAPVLRGGTPATDPRSEWRRSEGPTGFSSDPSRSRTSGPLPPEEVEMGEARGPLPLSDPRQQRSRNQFRIPIDALRHDTQLAVDAQLTPAVQLTADRQPMPMGSVPMGSSICRASTFSIVLPPSRESGLSWALKSTRIHRNAGPKG